MGRSIGDRLLSAGPVRFGFGGPNFSSEMRCRVLRAGHAEEIGCRKTDLLPLSWRT